MSGVRIDEWITLADAVESFGVDAKRLRDAHASRAIFGVTSPVPGYEILFRRGDVCRWLASQVSP